VAPTLVSIIMLTSTIIDPQYLQDTLTASFAAAKPAHGLEHARWQRYVGEVLGFHVAEFADGEHAYRVLFDKDHLLDFIHLENNPCVSWNRHEQSWTAVTAD
jgi:hypothetical protein